MPVFRKNITLVLIPLFIVCYLALTSCGKPTPSRVVEGYLEEISGDDIDEEYIESITWQKFRDDMAKDSLIGDIATGSGNIYDLFVPLMSSEDSRKVEAEYDFLVETREYVEGRIALVKVFVQPYKRRGVKSDDALNSETLHLKLKEILKENQKQDFQFKLKQDDDDEWKIQKLTLPSALEGVMIERASATVELPVPGEDQGKEADPNEVPAGDAP